VRRSPDVSDQEHRNDLEKLGRHGGSWLKSIQDIAGMRIVDSFDRWGQDDLVGRIAALFADEPRPPRVIDRRARPTHGYRAVHIVAYPDGIPVEIQVRTRWQHEWADLFEKLADGVGRGLRYGQMPDHWLSANEREALSSEERRRYESAYALRTDVVEVALGLSSVLDELEKAPRSDSVMEQTDDALRRVADVAHAIGQLTHLDVPTPQDRTRIRP
jgi:Region found in RelA / SpoT proteins